VPPSPCCSCARTARSSSTYSAAWLASGASSHDSHSCSRAFHCRKPASGGAAGLQRGRPGARAMPELRAFGPMHPI
jgi:hypothetical protein